MSTVAGAVVSSMSSSLFGASRLPDSVRILLVENREAIFTQTDRRTGWHRE